MNWGVVLYFAWFNSVVAVLLYRSDGPTLTAFLVAMLIALVNGRIARVVGIRVR